MQWNVEVQVWLKPSVFDPQGNAVEHALTTLGYQGFDQVRIGKYMQLRIEAASKEEADEKVKAACDAVLCNPVMETYAYTMVPAEAGASV
ncbi:phosphoribosylformylglycinamidine synthase subunit PurS [Alicyclobacillus tolerans]|uniref:phosphoribosylformylglycinamidine synthase subunit PurS n=1 Tax=Alicyclobacillus tolerans TaxID=90970 RepID=UPI001F36BBA5|nr:phosphoribosylformylglycinamidine synthase subunit PurS [Alicyclobacillus tolerans]MCF8566327.1 phosphoribosylformylglycinamidine synthase subunit PurS [Alicyclobacillus tolerans]